MTRGASRDDRGSAKELASLFAGHRELRAVVDAVLEGCQGRAAADGDAARLSLGCYEVFGGEAASRGARRLVSTAARPRELVYGNEPAWRRLILEVHAEQVSDRPMRDFDPAGLDRAALLRLETALPEGFALRRLDAGLAAQLDAELEPHGLQVFASPTDLVAHGVGFGAVTDGRVACAATSYTMSSRFVETAIATRPAFRGRGLAVAASAALLRHCLDAGVVPRWSASNPVSQRLAVRLGFRPAGVCEVLHLR
jgi:GNAT superfamily N-acetyltransferase